MVEVEDLLQMIDRIARTVSNDYPDIEYDDVYQTLALFVVQNGKSIKSREEGGNPNWLLKRVAHSYAKKERTEQLALSIQYSYKASDVSKMLETAWNLEDIEKTHVPEDAISLAGNDALEVGSDVRAALSTLSYDDRVSLFKRYALKEVPDNASYERKRLNQATKNLTFALNSYRGRGQYIGRRRVLSNASAQAIVANDW